MEMEYVNGAQGDIHIHTPTPQTNPLYNELVLETLFDYLPIRDLKNVRLLSKLWNNIASSFLREKSVVKLDENIHMQGTALERLLREFATIPQSKIFFRNYKLTLWNLDEEISRVMAFWEKFGKSIESLEISWTRFVGIWIVRSVMFEWAPNMKRLVLRDCNFYKEINFVNNSLTVVDKEAELDINVTRNPNLEYLSFFGGEPHTNPPISWKEIFIAYPNLRQLSLYNLTPTENMRILDAAKELRQQNPNSLEIQKLNIFNGDYAASEIPKVALETLKSLKFPLTQLDIDIGAHCDEYSIAKLFEQHSKQLKNMTIYRGPLGSPMSKFPFEIRFPSLRRLEMTETVADSFKFIMYMPNLKTLCLCEPPEVEPPFLPSDIVCKTDYNLNPKTLPINLRNLRIDYDITSSDIRKIVHWFPNVKKAKIYLDNDSFRTICGEWPQIEELEVLGDKVTDEGITGIQHKVENGEHICVRHTLWIINLKNLRSFKMRNYGMSTSLENESVHEGFLKMKSLTSLEVCSRHITEDAWKLLFDMSQLTTLLPTDGRWQSNIDAFRKTC